MRASTSLALASCAISGLRVPGAPTMASVTDPPRTGVIFAASGGGVAVQPASDAIASAAARPRRVRRPSLTGLRRRPPLARLGGEDVERRYDQEGDDKDPGGPVDLPFE